MVSTVSMKYINNCKEAALHKLEKQQKDLRYKIMGKYPHKNDNDEIPEIMKLIRDSLPENYKVTWKGQQYSCEHSRFYVNVQVCVKTDDVAIHNEKARKSKLTELETKYNELKAAVVDWEEPRVRTVAVEDLVDDVGERLDGQASGTDRIDGHGTRVLGEPG